MGSLDDLLAGEPPQPRGSALDQLLAAPAAGTPGNLLPRVLGFTAQEMLRPPGETLTGLPGRFLEGIGLEKELAQKAFDAVRAMRNRSEEIGPYLAQRGVPPVAAAAAASIPRAALEMIPASAPELAASVFGGEAVKGILGGLRGAASGLADWMKTGFPEAAAWATGANSNAVKSRILSSVDPFSGELTNPEAMQNILAKVGGALKIKREQAGQALEALGRFLDEKSMEKTGTGKVFPMGIIRNMALQMLHDPDTGRPVEALPQILNALTPSASKESGPLGNTTMMAAIKMLRRARDVLDYGARDPLGVRIVPQGSNEERMISDFLDKFKNSIQGIAKKIDPLGGHAYAFQLNQFHDLARNMGELSSELLSKNQPEVKLMQAFARRGGGLMPRLNEIASQLPELEQGLREAHKVFVSTSLQGKFRPVATGLSLLPSAIGGALGGLAGGPAGAVSAAAAPVAASLLFAPRPGSFLARQAYRTLTPTIQAAASGIRPFENVLLNPYIREPLRAAVFQ